MTADAFLAKPAFVGVVFLVAGETIDGSLVLIELPLMTGFAFGSKVSSEQRVLGVQLMIEDDGLPIALGMAGLALLSVTPFMRVVFFVAGIAIHWSVFEGGRRVALLALSGFMLSD